MIENIRNYYGLMMVVLVAIFVSFLFSDLGGPKSLGGGDDYMRINGTTYSISNYQKEGEASMQLAMQLGMMDFVYPLMGMSGGEPGETFFTKRMLLRQAGEKFGVYPSHEEIADYVKNMRVFANRTTGKYDPKAYSTIIQNRIGSLGMTEADVLALAKDALTMRKLGDIVGAGLHSNRDVVAQDLALSRQKITADVARVSIEPFKAAIKPSDEDLKNYWEVIQESFKTEPLRKFTYILATPAPVTVATPEGEDKTEEVAKPDPTKEDPKLIEEKRKQDIALNQQVTKFVQSLQNSQGSNFEALAQENGFEVHSTELFSATTAPPDLALKVRSQGPGRSSSIVQDLFAMTTTSDPLSKISEPLAVGEHQWLVARLDEEVVSRVKTFEEAKEEVTADYINKKAHEALVKDVEEKIAKVREAVAAGKSFAEAVKEQGLESQHLENITASYRPTDGNTPLTLFQHLSAVDPGSVADPIIESANAFIVFVEKREVEKAPNPEMAIDTEVAGSNSQNEGMAFMSWMMENHQSADIQPLYKTRN